MAGGTGAPAAATAATVMAAPAVVAARRVRATFGVLGWRRVLAAALAALIAALTLGSVDARAGSYMVRVCDLGYGNVDHVVAHSASYATASYTTCNPDSAGRLQGVKVLSTQNSSTAAAFATASATINAPAGTTISSVDFAGIDGHNAGSGWIDGFQASSDRFATGAWWLSGSCTNTAVSCGTAGSDSAHWDLTGATGFRTVVSCAYAGGCFAPWTSTYPNSTAWVFAHTLKLSISDPAAPDLINGRGAAWSAGAWHKGVESIGFDANDATGVSGMRVELFPAGAGVTPGWPVDRAFGCDYTYLVPCANQRLDTTVDTRELPDGPNTIRLAAGDAAGNWRWVDAPLSVDNHAPGRVTNFSISGGEGWSPAPTRTITWRNPGDQVAPIDGAYIEVCKGTSCQWQSAFRINPESQQISAFAGPGDYTVRLFVGDAAGNATRDAFSDTLHMRFDNVPPQQATPQHRNGWVNASEAKGYVQRIDAPEPTKVPLSGVAGYATTTDGTSPAGAVEVHANPSDYSAQTDVGDLGEGVTHFKARAISGAGVASGEVGTEDIHVDVRPPTVSIDGHPDPDAWSRTAVTLRVTATEPAERSGMAGAEATDPQDTHGGYIAYAIDGGATRIARGVERPEDPNTGIRGFEPSATASIDVPGDGRHTVTYSATDVAGNASAPKTVSFRIDRTAPDPVAFEAQHEDDPTLIAVVAADASSGLADGGTIRLRRIRPTAGDWLELHTTRDGSRYYGHLDNKQLPEGDYQFQAVVSDQAGNSATGERNVRGEPEVLHIDPTHVGPYRTDTDSPPGGRDVVADGGATVATRITARIVVRTKVRAKRCRTGVRRCPNRSRTVERLVSRARVPFGKPARTRGTVASASGEPIANAEITVLAKPDAARAEFRAEGVVRSDAAGRFAYTARAGASRRLDFLYRGSSRYKRSDAAVDLKVPAAATMRSSRGAIRNGSSVLFTGKLLGRPFPAKGKVVDLQAFYRGRWRTFATSRARRSGAWRFRYRFEATRGRVVYRFRVRVRQSSDYPYGLGYSRVIRVTVTGR